MNEDELLRSLVDYCETSATDYAVLINGEWGTGKSYFWRLSAEPALADKGFTPIYVSLHGASSTDEITAYVMLALIPLVGKKIPKGLVRLALAAIEKYRAAGILEDGLAKIDKNRVVFCFDDLERVRDLDAALAFIASLAEGGAKIVVLAAEEEILDDKDMEKTYGRRKEKIIGQTFDFSPDPGALIRSMIPSTVTSKRAQEFLQTQAEEIVELVWSEDDSPNLRSVRHGLRMFERIDARISGRSNAHETVRFDLLRLCLGLAIQLRSDIRNREYLETINKPDFSPAFAMNFVRTHGVVGREDIFDIYDFLRAYGVRTPAAPKYSAVYDFALTGWLNEEQLDADIRDHVNLLSGRKIDAVQAILSDFSILQDKDFRGAAEALLTTLASKKMTNVVEIYRAAQRLAFCSVNRLIDKDLNHVLDLTESVVADLSRTGKLAGQDVNWGDATFRHGDIEVDRYAAFCDMLIRANAAALLADQKKELKGVLDKSDLSGVIRYLRLQYRPSTNRPTLPFFHAIDLTQLLGLLGRSKNIEIADLRMYIEERYQGFAYKIPELKLVARLPSELTALRDLQEQVVEQSMQREGQLSAVIFRDLANSIKSASTVVKNIESKLEQEGHRGL